MKMQMTPLERCALLGHPWQQAACPGWFLRSRCGAVRTPGQVAVSLPRGQEPPAPSQDVPSPQRGGHV
jgi:hypothetical protein